MVLALLLVYHLPGIVFASADGGAETGMTHRMMMLVIQLGVILFVAKLGGILFEKFRMPGVLGELTAGMIIGPFALGGISFYGFPEGLFPTFFQLFPVSPELYGFASVAAILLLFMVGLETDINLFKRFYRAGVAVGLGGVLFSFVFGAAIMILFSRWVLGESIGYMHPSALFLGAISSATSVGITARILSEKQKIGSPEGVTILAGAVIDDVLGIIMLAIILGVISVSQAGGIIDWLSIEIIAMKAIGIWLIATFTGLAAAGKISFMLKLFRGKTSIALMALGLALILAGLFEQVGLAMIIGAYVMGLSLSQTDISQVIQEKLQVIYGFLVPIFFCVMGMLVDFSAIGSAPVLIFGLIYSMVAILAKVLGCGIPSLFFDFNLRGAVRIGFGMLPRGEVALIMAGVGLATGAFEPKLFGVSILMVVVTTMAAPPVLVSLLKNLQPGTRRKIPTREIKTLSFPFPSKEITELLTGKLLKIFESEGFFVSLLDIQRRQYQMRKENIVINFRHLPDELLFHCQGSQTPLINAVMYEVIAELEKTIKGLQKPIDREAIGRKLQTRIDKIEVKINLSQYLTPDMVEAELKGNTKREIIEELLTMLQKSGKISDLKAAGSAIWEREESISTGIQYGIAIPHAKTDAVSLLVCAIGVKRAGVDFGSIDGKLSRIFVLTLAPKTATSPYLQFLSVISRLLSNQTVREQVLSCKNSKELYRVLTTEIEHNFTK